MKYEFTKEDLEDLIHVIKTDPFDWNMTDDVAEMIVEALEFYKDTHYIA